MPSFLPDLFGWVAAAIGAVLAVPQWLRVRRSTDLAGVSSLTWALSTCAAALWTAYSFAVFSLPLIVGNGLALVTFWFVLAALVRRGQVTTTGWVSLGFTVTLAALLWIVAPLALGWAATALSVSMRLPQLAHLRTGTNAGLSFLTWQLATVSAALWVVYGLLIGSWPVVVTDGWALIVSLSIVVAARRLGKDRGSAIGARVFARRNP